MIAVVTDRQVRCDRCGRVLAVVSGTLPAGVRIVIRCPRCGTDTVKAA